MGLPGRVHWGVDSTCFLHCTEIARTRCIETGRSGKHHSNDSILILAVGGLQREKHGMLIRAFSKVLEKTTAHLVIIGRGSLKRRPIRLASNLGIDDNMSIESSMDFQSIAEMYRHADIVAYPSYYEGQGLIPLRHGKLYSCHGESGHYPRWWTRCRSTIRDGFEDSLAETIFWRSLQNPTLLRIKWKKQSIVRFQFRR